MHKGREEIHGAVNDVESTSRPSGLRWKVVVKLGVQVELVLNEPSNMRAQYAGLVSRRSGAIVADGRIFAERNAHTNYLVQMSVSVFAGLLIMPPYLLRNVLHVLPDQVIAAWMV